VAHASAYRCWLRHFKIDHGLATVQLPEWVEVLNADFRYQLTVMGQFAQAIAASKIAIAASPSGPISPRGSLLAGDGRAAGRLRQSASPELHGAPAEKQIEWARHPQMMQRMKEWRAKAQPAVKAAAPPQTVQAST